MVEVDGEVHAGNEAQDAARTAHLMAYGVRVRKDEVLGELESVLARILTAAEGG